MQKHIYIIAFSLILSGCASYSVRPPPSIVNDSEISKSRPNQDEGLDIYLAFNKAYFSARQNPSSANNALLLSEGMDLVSANCMLYFAKLGGADQHLRFARKETALAGGFIASALALANATPKAIANTAAIFSFTAASMDSYADTYIFSPDVKAVEALVRSALDAQKIIGAAEISAVQNGNTLSYSRVANFLLVMEGICQPHGVRALVNKAVEGQSAVPGAAPMFAAAPSTAIPAVPVIPQDPAIEAPTSPASPASPSEAVTSSPGPIVIPKESAPLEPLIGKKFAAPFSQSLKLVPNPNR